MKKLLMLLSAAALVFGMVGMASAASYTAFDDIPGMIYMWEDREISWTFDINPAGFDPLKETVTSATISLGLRALGVDTLFPEYASLDVGLNIFNWEVDTGIAAFALTSFINLNTDGTAVATFKATDGNFRFYWAKLEADTETATAPVPEPATILLMGTGLLGLVAYSRKLYSKKS